MYNHKYQFSKGEKSTIIDFLELKNYKENISFLDIDVLEIVDIPKDVPVFYLEMYLNVLYEIEEQQEQANNLAKEVFKE